MASIDKKESINKVESRDSSRPAVYQNKMIRVPTEESEKIEKVPPAIFKAAVLQPLPGSVGSLSPKGFDGNVKSKQKPIKQLIIYPKTLPKQPDINNSFISFNALLQSNHGRDLDLSHGDLRGSQSSRDIMQKQLDFNKKQEMEFRKNAKLDFVNSYENLVAMLEEEKQKKRKMPPVRAYPKNQSQPTVEFAKDLLDTEENREDEPMAIRNKMLKLTDKAYQTFWYPPPEEETWRPEAREGASFVVQNNYGYLYGGVSQELHEDMLMIDARNWKWRKIEPKGDVPQHGRYGHSASSYKNTIVIFGGEKMYNQSLRIRECLGDVLFFMTDTGSWKQKTCYGEFAEPRRNHIGITVGKHLIVQGGINNYGNFLCDLRSLNFSMRYNLDINFLDNMKWSPCIEEDSYGMGVAFHQACLVIYPDRKESIDLYKMGDHKNSDKTYIIKEEGVYFFGGKGEDGAAINTLKILKIGQKPLRWITPKTSGSPPAPRFLHSMVHMPSLNVVVIYGGRNDEMSTSSRSPILEDIYLLELESLTWCSVQTQGFSRAPRCSHVAGVYGTKMLVFGGLNYNRYVTTEINILEFDQTDVSKLQKNYEKRQLLPDISANNTNTFQAPKKKEEHKELFEKYSGLLTFLPIPKKAQLQKQGIQPIIKLEDPENSAKHSRKTLNYKFDNFRRKVTTFLGLPKSGSVSNKVGFNPILPGGMSPVLEK